MPKISVIIPVYNCAKYLPMCLDSIIYQTYDNLEIICINDGSKDNSGKILEQYKQKDTRIKVITQHNQGQSIARNKGIEAATGNYISFIDGDDWVSLSLYQKFAKKLKEIKQDIDIYMFNACDYYEKAQNLYLTQIFNIKNWKPKQNQLYVFDDCMNPFTGNMSPCNKIYKTEFLKEHNIRFTEGLIFEDQLFFLQTFMPAKTIFINNENLYMYRRENNSSTMNRINKNVFDIFKIINKMESYLKNTNNYEEYKYAFFQHKYIQYSFLFFKTPLNHKPRFYDEMKARLMLCEQENLKKDICTRLVNYDVYQDILKLNWFDFYQKYKNRRK